MRAIDPVCTFDEKTHRYFLRGRSALGVSQILELAGISNFSFVNKDLLTRAQNFGAAAHKAAELSDRGNLDRSSLDAPLAPYLESWEAFRAKELSEILQIEQPVYSLKFGFAGTPDRIARDKAGRLVIVDIKTSREFHAAVKLQTAGYEIAFEEMAKAPRVKIQRRIGVILTDTGEPYVEDFGDRTDRDDFIACARVAAFKLRNGMGKTEGGGRNAS